MGKKLLAEADSCLDRKKRHRIWMKVVSILACLVVFCTTYALILPAITLEHATCGMEEHLHSEECYEPAPVQTIRELVCTEESLNIHQHTETCYEEEKNLICGYADSVIHIHDDNCYDPDGNLICTLPEVEEQKPEIIAHTHVQECYDEAGFLICGKTEIQKHQHNEDCFRTTEQKIGERELICGQTEHTHSDACYKKEKQNEVDEVPAGEDEKENRILSEDDALVSELAAAEIQVVSEQGEISDSAATAQNQDTVKYSFCVKTKSYTDTPYDQGRVKLEFVLPGSTQQADFLLEDMKWLDDSEGYEPTVTTEERVINEEKKACQILTGYKLLESDKEGTSIIPGEFTEQVSVKVKDMEQEEILALQICAAMEYNNWNDICEVHKKEEKLTITTKSVKIVKESKDLEELEESGKGTLESIAEPEEGTNWIALRDSGWFEAYSDFTDTVSKADTEEIEGTEMCVSPVLMSAESAGSADAQEAVTSDQQVVDAGGTNQSEDGSVVVSKTIKGTELENVFDITLQVQTDINLSEICEEPDMAVVIVMDISNTMNSNFSGVTRYAAAMESAEGFLDRFAANNSLDISKIGYVAFNTDAHKIFELQSCSDTAQANALKNTMRTETGKIINASGYNEDHSRFTNIEAGLAMAADMLNDCSNKNKFMIFLSDGFPTTYISSGYSGYDPYDSTGERFYDSVLKKKCLYGTSYSDKAAIRARKKAAEIKNSGIDIFSIGVDVAGQTIQKYVTQSENENGFSVVDRTSTIYEIGNASSTEAYKNWLKNSIGSGYYYDSTDKSGLENAYNQIFEEIKQKVEAGFQADWVTNDPVPAETIEFISFYNKTPELVSGNLQGTYTENGENTASYDNSEKTIHWDLKNSGYTKTVSGSQTTYTYQLVYRVHLQNEANDFAEGNAYHTNGTTTLQYRYIETKGGISKISDPKFVDFPIPSVKGHLAELKFMKTDAASSQHPLQGAEFTLSHDTRQCSICRGDHTSVTIQDMTAVSQEDGNVTFANIPSGHRYTLTETKVPDGYSPSSNAYQVKVAYDELQVIVTSPGGEEKEWNGIIENLAYHELPHTGGSGTGWYMVGGIFLMTGSGILLTYKYVKRRKWKIF